jgi:hypothetical protein
MLQNDMGDPDWVDWYWDYRSPFTPPTDGFVGVAYSISGSLLGDYSLYDRFIDKCKALFLYECPLLNDIIPLGDFPVTLIWNKRKWMPQKRKLEMLDTAIRWKVNHPVEEIEANGGKGLLYRHLEPKPYWPFVGHAWDRGINHKIESAINALAI